MALIYVTTRFVSPVYSKASADLTAQTPMSLPAGVSVFSKAGPSDGGFRQVQIPSTVPVFIGGRPVNPPSTPVWILAANATDPFAVETPPISTPISGLVAAGLGVAAVAAGVGLTMMAARR